MRKIENQMLTAIRVGANVTTKKGKTFLDGKEVC